MCLVIFKSSFQYLPYVSEYWEKPIYYLSIYRSILPSLCLGVLSSRGGFLLGKQGYRYVNLENIEAFCVYVYECMHACMYVCLSMYVCMTAWMHACIGIPHGHNMYVNPPCSSSVCFILHGMFVCKFYVSKYAIFCICNSLQFLFVWCPMFQIWLKIWSSPGFTTSRARAQTAGGSRDVSPCKITR